MPDAFDTIIARLRRANASARVGVFKPGDEEEAFHLACAEFGTVVRGQEHEPERPTLSTAYDAGEAGLLRDMAHGLGLLLDGRVGDGAAGLLPAAEQLAEVHQAAVRSNTPPPLAPSTLADRRRRGIASTATLVDSRKMLEAIGAEAKPGAAGWPADDG